MTRPRLHASATVIVCFALASAATADESADDLSSQATDPTASLMSFNFIGDYTASFHGPDRGLDDDSIAITFRPVIPFQAFGRSHILRVTMPYLTDGRGETGLGDVTVFDIAVIPQSWGRLAAGAVVSFATDDDADDPIAAGPALGFVRPLSKRLNVGLFNQNLFGGDTAITNLQPIIAYQFGQGWSVSAGDAQFIYDWEDDRWLSIPLGVQVGKVTKWGQQPMRVSLNPQYNFADDDFLPEWTVKLTLTMLVPSG